METYKEREIQFKDIQSIKEWKVKRYSIAYNNESFSETLENESLQLLQNVLPKIDNTNYGVGFMIVHHGKGANFVLIDWWCKENELKHLVYYSSKESPEKLILQNGSSPIACVWDLIVINHERNAWVEHMMTEKPKFSNYLKNYIHGNY